MPPVQWSKLFILTTSPLELFIRGSVIYLFILVLMRLLRREPGTIGIADLLMVVLIADASQNAMAGDYNSIIDGLILVLTIVFWNYLFDWLSLRSRTIERFTYPPAVPLLQNQKINKVNMRKQFVTEEQLMSILREHGIDRVADVKSVFLEGSGHVSVIPADDQQNKKGEEDDHRKRKIG
jgi:uncharacterized membrane protein YcaP (DUF421 family)